MSFNAVKKAGFLVAALLLMIHSSSSFAAVGIASGTVAEIRANGSTFNIENAILITGVTTLVACPASASNPGPVLVTMRIKSDAQGRSQLRVALAAQLVGKTVTVVVDDSILDSYGYCYLRAIQIDS